MTASNDNNQALADPIMETLIRFADYLDPAVARVGKNGFQLSGLARYYTDLFLYYGKLGRLKEPAALVENCIVMARKGAAFHGDTPRGQELKSLAELFERYPEEVAAYASEWETEVIRRFGGAK